MKGIVYYLPLQSSAYELNNKHNNKYASNIKMPTTVSSSQSNPAKNPTPAPTPNIIHPMPDARPLISTRPAAPVKFIAPVPLIPPIPLMPLIPRMPPVGIDITEPSDIVIIGSIDAVLSMRMVVDPDAARAATDSLPHSMVTAPREGVGIAIILGADVVLGLLLVVALLLDCARAEDAVARKRVVRVEKCMVAVAEFGRWCWYIRMSALII